MITGRFGRSVTFATEQQRKLVREIVKQSRTPVKSRVIPSKVIDKYASKIGKIEPDVARVVEEERAEREIAMLENRANRMQKEIKNGPDDRAWIDKSKAKKKQNQDVAREKGKKARLKRKLDKLDPEQRQDIETASWVSRSAKKDKRPKKMRKVIEDNHQKIRGTRGGINKKKKKINGKKK